MKFVKHKWYKSKCSNVIVCYQEKSEAYGFNSSGEWVRHDMWNFNDSLWKEATSIEVNKALFNYANKQYPRGTILDNYKETIINANLSVVNQSIYISGDTTLSERIIYQNGNWTGILKKANFIIDKWYEANGVFICYQGKDTGYGFYRDNHWVVRDGWTFNVNESLWKEADMDVIKSKLLDYANRNYPLGTRHTGWPGDKFRNHTFPFDYINDVLDYNFTVKDTLTWKGNKIIPMTGTGCIYKEGLWSEKSVKLAEVKMTNDLEKKANSKKLDVLLKVELKITSKRIVLCEEKWKLKLLKPLEKSGVHGHQ